MIKIEALMSTGVTTVADHATVKEALETMNVVGIRHLPVSDQGHHVVGIVSDRDLKSAKSKQRRVGEVMTKEVIVVHPEDPAEMAAELMLEHKLGSLPVVDAQENLVGIITESDFLQVARRALSSRSLRRSGE